jgi:hypothetical protein
MYQEIEKAITTMANRIVASEKADDAMKYAQAISNLAHGASALRHSALDRSAPPQIPQPDPIR